MRQSDRFTARAKTAIEKAQTAAEALGHSYVGSEHLLLGILREEGGQGAQVLRSNGLTEWKRLWGAGSLTRCRRGSRRGRGGSSNWPSATRAAWVTALSARSIC